MIVLSSFHYSGCITLSLGHCFPEQSRKGSLFSLFLFSPLVAFCYVCSIADLRSDLWDSCHRQVRRIMNDCLRVFYDWSRCVGKSTAHALGLSKNCFKSTVLLLVVIPSNGGISVGNAITNQIKSLAHCNFNWQAGDWIVGSLQTYKCFCCPFKIFLRFWLAKSTRLTYHNELLLTKFGRILRLINRRLQNSPNFCVFKYARVLGSIGVMLMSCKVNFHVTQSALQNSLCLPSIFCWLGFL